MARAKDKDNLTPFTFRLHKDTVTLLKKELAKGNLSEEVRDLLSLRLRAARTRTPIILGSEVARVCSDACGRYGHEATPQSALVREVAEYIKDALLSAASDDSL